MEEGGGGGLVSKSSFFSINLHEQDMTYNLQLCSF
jgi:hypothetical protein